MDLDRGVIKFVDSEGLTRRVLVRKNSETVMTFDGFTEHIRGVFALSNKIRLKYCRDGEVIVVDDEVGWEETSMSLVHKEILDVVIEHLTLKFDDYLKGHKRTWEQISLNSIGILP